MLANQITPIDIYIASKLQEIRIKSGLTQDKLGELVGVSCQQIQKYESAKNRITSSRLFEFSQILKVPITEFFNGLLSDKSYYNYEFVNNEKMVINFLKDKKNEAILLGSFRAIESVEVKKNLLNLVLSVSKNKKNKIKHAYSK